MNSLKQEYNKMLIRYYNGCNYIETHMDECDKYLPEVQKLLNRLNSILKQIPEAKEEEILNGFET